MILVDCLVKEFLVKSLKLGTAAPVASKAHTNTFDGQVGSVAAIGPKLQPALAAGTWTLTSWLIWKKIKADLMKGRRLSFQWGSCFCRVAPPGLSVRI